VKFPYSVEMDPAVQSTAQTTAIARENLPRRLAVDICENLPIMYASLYDPLNSWNDLVTPKT
jgi:hypothetical protein